MYGQMKTPEADPLQETVDKFIEENNPYGPFKPLRINLRKYLKYAEEHHITDPSTIPEEILDTFMLPEKDQKRVLCTLGG